METTIGPTNSWRLVHNGTDVFVLMESAGFTTTIYTIFEAQTEKECLDEVARLGLVMLQEPSESEF